MLPDRVTNPGPLTYESGALPIVLRGLAYLQEICELLFIKLSNALQVDLLTRSLGFRCFEQPGTEWDVCDCNKYQDPVGQN